MINIVFFAWALWLKISASHLSFVKPELIEHGDRDKKLVALTFDACMTPRMKDELEKGSVPSWYNKKVVDILRENKVPATFFVSGLWAKSYPEVVKNWFNDKDNLFEIENHSWDHAAMKTPCYGLADAKNRDQEITLTQNELFGLTGIFPKYFRFPGGCYNPEDLTLLSKFGMKAVDWDVISGDAFLKNPEKIKAEVLSKTQNGSIVIMHVVGGRTAPATAEALQGIIDGLTEKGFKFVKVEELFN